MDEKGKEKEKNKTKKDKINNSEIQRSEDKKSTLNLSEIPNIINESSECYAKTKSDGIFMDENSLTNGIYNSTKLKRSYINEPISHTKEDTRSCLEEIQTLLRATISDNQNIISGQKEKRHKFHSKQKSSSNEHINIKNKEKEKNNNNEDKPKHFSSKKKVNNIFSDEDQKDEKNKKIKIKFRKSEIIKRYKKEEMGEDDEKKKKIKRRSLFSQGSPEKIYKNNIYQKYFKKKSFESKDGKRNEDKIYLNIENKEELVITVNTEQETVKNYYKNMEECFEIIDLYFNKTIKLQYGEPVNFNFKENKKLVIFELESTLISCLDESLPNKINNDKRISIRPHLKSSLDLIKKYYNIVIYSSNNKNYVDKILDLLDPEHNYFNYRLYKEHCFQFKINNKTYFTKNLNIFKNICSLKDIIIVDCSVLGFGFFLENGIPIIPYYDSKEDVELKILSYYLASISSNNDIREALKRDIKLGDYLEEAKKRNEKNKVSPEKKDIHEKAEIKKNKKSKDKNKEKNGKASSPENVKRKNKNKTCKNTNINHFFKSSSDYDEDKKQTIKTKSPDKIKKNKKEKEKEKDNDKMCPRKCRYFSTKLIKKKNRKYTETDLNRNNTNIKSPKINSLSKTNRNSGKKNNDKNKKFINEK